MEKGEPPPPPPPPLTTPTPPAGCSVFTSFLPPPSPVGIALAAEKHILSAGKVYAFPRLSIYLISSRYNLMNINSLQPTILAYTLPYFPLIFHLFSALLFLIFLTWRRRNGKGREGKREAPRPAGKAGGGASAKEEEGDQRSCFGR